MLIDETVDRITIDENTPRGPIPDDPEGREAVAAVEIALKDLDIRAVVRKRFNGYASALMGFDFADTETLNLARHKFAEHLEQNGMDGETAEEEATRLNRSWEFATYAFCSTGEGEGDESGYDCVYCGIHRYHLPGQHDQCDHSITGECTDEQSAIRSDQASELFGAYSPQKADKDTFKKYSGGISLDVNGYLREGDSKNKEFDAVTKTLDSALAKSVLKKDITVYRGMNISEEQLGKLQKGTIFTDRAFISTSRSRSTAQQFVHNGVLTEIKLPAGSRALNVMPFSSFRGEMEVLVPRNAKLKIIDFSSTGNKRVLKLELIQ